MIREFFIGNCYTASLYIGLLSLLAERGVPLCGLSATADATAALTPIDRARLETDLARILELTLCETDRSVG